MDECLGLISEDPSSCLNPTSRPLEIEFLCLHVGSRIKVEGPALCVWDQGGIFINLERTDVTVTGTPEHWQTTPIDASAAKILTSSPEKYRSIISKANL